MNFFFTLNGEGLDNQIIIPKFTNKNYKKKNYKLFRASPINDKWEISNIKTKEDNDFYFLHFFNHQNSEDIFFLASYEEVKNIEKNNFEKLLNLNSFTDTMPSYRANLKIKNEFGGFSSYQSEYPYEMTIKNGSVLSPLSVLLSNKNDYNFIFYRNIFYKPIKHKFDIFFINIENKEILFKQTLFTNSSNQILVDKKFIKKNVYFFAKGYLGIPIFLSIKNNHLSFEHTHPPHLYILSDNKFKIISKLKEKIDEIVN
tara:strand:+ start:87 stop:857 length:771 start_codon:yes stop_codon:yes gene_type:complete